MRKSILVSVALLTLALAAIAVAKPTVHRLELSADNPYVDRVGDLDGTLADPSKTALADTLWIADWTFDGADGACDDSGWEKIDYRNLRDHSGSDAVYWRVDPGFDGLGGIAGHAAVCGNQELGCENVDGYGNYWYQGMRISYSGSGSLSFDYLLDSEPSFDFLRVELDSACASFDLTDKDKDGILDDVELGVWGNFLFRESSYAAGFRTDELVGSGLNLAGRVESMPITDFGTDDTHCVYIAFFSDTGFSPCDGLVPTTIGAAVVIDNVEIVGVDVPLSEDFESTVDSRIEFANLWDDVSVGEWARVYSRVTDNDICTENTTCAWLFTDSITPTIATDASMAFGPGGFVIRNWLDDVIVSPWASLGESQLARETVLSYREFGGNVFSNSKIVRNWSVRTKRRIHDTAAPGDSVDFVTRWGHIGGWNLLDPFFWKTWLWDASQFVPQSATHMQLRFRIADFQWIRNSPSPTLHESGPGPYIDRIRIGRRSLDGPVFDVGIDSRSQSQDAFPTEIHPFVTPAGEHHRPDTGPNPRFGTAAFSRSGDLSHNDPDPPGPNLITGDSISIRVQDLRNANGILRVEWYGAIISGPHTGKAPPPRSVNSNGFFIVPADSVRERDGTVVDAEWFVDLDDDYFRGGDVLRYFWFAEDGLGGASSDPAGMNAVPTSLEEAEAATGGLFEFNALPTITWDPAYLARIAADPHGKIEPSEEEVANSQQANCILYYQLANTGRKSGDANRTSFMYTLDQLGYRGHYDVYDIQGLGNTNNQLGGRATVEQATGYALIIQDSGRQVPNKWILPDGINLDSHKVDQASWYRDWLASGGVSEAGSATLWLIGSRITEAITSYPLVVTDMGVQLSSPDVLPAMGANPDVAGQASFALANGNTADFVGDQFTVEAACPTFPPYNGLGASGTAVVTHSWARGTNNLGDGAIVMNANPTQSWNTIMQVPTWPSIRDPESTPSSPEPEEQLLAKILDGVLQPDCIQSPDPTTDVRDERDQLDNLPKVTALYQNVPNPFNPVTTIRFDLARDGHVDLRIYDVTGRLVRKLIDESMTSERHKLVWDGLDDAGVSVSSGIYFYRLETAGFRDTHKMVVLR